MRSTHPFFAVALSALAAGAGCGRTGAKSARSSSESKAAAGLPRVAAKAPERKTLTRYTSQPGRIEAFEETPLHPKLAGYVDSVLVDIGDLVKKGQVLVKLAIPELHDELKQKEALAAQAAAEVNQAEAAVRAAKAAVESAAAKVALAEAGIGRADGEYERSNSEHERHRALAAKGSVTAKLAEETLNQLRSAEAARREAVAGVTAAKAGWNEAQANVQKAEADKVSAEARLRVAQANLAGVRTMIAYTEIKSPFDGVVTRRSIDTGYFVQPAGANAPALLAVARTDRVRIFVDIPEMEAPLVTAGENGDAVVIRVQSLGDREFDAKVTRTSWSLDASNRALRVEIERDNKEGWLRPGMFATATILLDRRDNVLALPTSAIVGAGKATSCCCVTDGVIEVKPVVLGLRAGSEVEIRSGVDESLLVVQTGSESLKPGQLVEIVKPVQ